MRMSGEGSEVYELLIGLWRAERESRELAELPEKLEKLLREYVARAKAYLKVSDKHSLTAGLREAELRAVIQLAERLFELRTEKIVRAAMCGEVPENLYGFEHTLYSDLRRLLTDHRERVRTLTQVIAYKDWKPIEAGYELVCFLTDFPQIVGEDLKTYGPFKSGDIASLPPGNARALLMRGVVRRLRVLEPELSQ